MKNNLLTKTLFALAVLFSTMAQAVQLSGNYTIDANGTASATVFKNFASAITYMTSTGVRSDGGPANTGTVGVSGPVVFNVAAGTYTVTAVISIPAVTGASPVNTITFDGGAGNAATRIITGSISARPILVFSLCKYVTVQNLTINNTIAGSGANVNFYANTTTGWSATSAPNGSCNALRNCILGLPNAGSSTGANVVLSSSATGYYYGSGTSYYGDSNVVENNTMTSSAYYGGINVYGVNSTSYNRGNRFVNNTINNPYYYGMFVYYLQNATDIMYNTINCNGTSTYYGLYYYANSSSSVSTGSNPTRIIGNKILQYKGYGLYVNYANGTAAAPTQVYSNIAAGSAIQSYYDAYLYMTSGYYMDVNGNTFVHNGNNSGYYAMYYYGSTAASFKNNQFIVTSGGTSYCAYFSTNPTGNVVNYNNYWHSNGASGNLLYRGGTFTAANYLSTTAGGDSSFNVKPSFANATNFDFHLSDACAPKGVAYPLNPFDVDAEPRSLTAPIVGADESTSLSNEIALTSVISPSIPITLGLQDVIVKVKNTGSNVINNFDINYIQNGGATVSQTWTGTLNPCDEVTVTMTGPNQINLVSSNNVKVFTSAPNSSLDNRRTNDTITMQFFAPLSGTYTIGGINPDFLTFGQATNALSSGIMGPVVFDVRPGTYSEQVTIPAAAGSSPINTIKFIGQDVNNCIITTNAASQAAVRLNGCKYVTLENLNIRNTNGTGAGIGVIGNTSNNAGGCNTIRKCIINMVNGTGTQYGICVGAVASGYGVTSNWVDSVTCDSNVFNNGYYGMYWYGYTTTGAGIYNRGHRIRGNTLNNMYYMGMYLYYISGGMEVRNNKVNMTTTLGQTSQYGMYAYMYGYQASQYKGITSIIDGNIIDANYIGMYIYYPYGTYNNPVRITNNIIKPSFNRYSSSSAYGIYLYSYTSVAVSDPTPTILFYHNSIYYNGSGYGLYFSSDGGGNQGKVDFKNNIFACGQSANSAAYIGSNPNTGSTTPIDYNIYYRVGGGNVLYRNGIYYDQSNVVSFAGGGSNSYYLNPPPFANVAAGDLHITNACTKGTNALQYVPFDVDGEQRNAQPNIGADEYPGLSRDVSVDAIVSPVFPIQAGLQNLTLRVRNNGSDVINSFNISYTLNNGPAVTIPWVGTLLPCNSVEVLFNGLNQIDIPNASNTFVAWTSNPNGSNDQMPSNDTLKSSALAPPMAGAYSIAASGGDFTNLTNAVNALNVRGMGGAVTFNVAPGTYIEPAAVQLANVIGLSDTSRLLIQSTSGLTSNTIIQSAASPVLGLTNVSYVRLNGIQLKQTVAGGNVMNLTGLVTNCDFYNVHFNGPLTTSTSYVVYQNGSALRNVSFKRSTFQGCYYGLYLYSTSTYAGQNADVVIDSNTFTQISYYDWYLLYHRNMKIRYNTININNGANTSYAYLYGPMYPDSALEMSYNTLNNTSTGYYYWYYVGYFGNGGYLPASRTTVHHNKVVYQQTSGYGYWYYWGYYGNRQDYYSNSMVPSSASNYTYVYYPGYYSNGTVYHSNSWPMNSAYMAYTGYTSGAGSRWYNNSIHSTTSYTWYYHYAGTSSGDGFQMYNNSLTNSGGGNVIYTSGAFNANDKFDYNNFYTTGATMLTGGTTYSTINDMKNAGYCLNCLSADAGYTNINRDLRPNAANANSWTLNGRGVQNTYASADMDDQPRSAEQATGAQDLGAYEFTPTATPNACTLTPTAPPVAGGVQVVLYGRDTVARLIWAGGSVPTSVTVRQYSGANPQGVILNGGYYMNAYLDIAVSPAGSYNYSLEMYHKGIWNGTCPSATSIIGAQMFGAWQFLFSSSNDVQNRKLVMNNLTNFGQFTGTDANTPFTPSLVVMSDKNKQNVVTEPLNVYPNPFNSDLNVRIDLSHAGNVTITLIDITGKTVATKVDNLPAGVNQTTLSGMNDLKAGIYFLNVEMNGQNYVQKLVKQ